MARVVRLTYVRQFMYQYIEIAFRFTFNSVADNDNNDLFRVKHIFIERNNDEYV